VTDDPYLDPRTGVLRNRLGIVDADELTQVESDLTVVQMVELERRHLLGRYDLPHLQEFHRFLFGDIYDWAGELRTVTIEPSGRSSASWPAMPGTGSTGRRWRQRPISRPHRHRFEATTPHCVRCWTRSWIAPTSNDARCNPGAYLLVGARSASAAEVVAA